MVISQLKATLENDGQLFAMIQGCAGSGKSTISKHFAEQLGLRVITSATTGSAAALLKTVTINTLLHLGRSTDKCDLAKDTTSPSIKREIRQLFENIDVLLIDEVSMLTPVTLARIDSRMRECLDPDKPFGGKHIILLGDMWQFEPVSFELRKPALYQGMVLLARNRKLPGDHAYRAGVNIFSNFRLFVLEGQKRATEDYAKFLKVLRNTMKKCPITYEWIKDLKHLESEDIRNDPDWNWATIATTGNVERMKIIEVQAKRFGKVKNEPILNWSCPIKCGKIGGKNIYREVDFGDDQMSDQYCRLNRYFVRGAECVLGENICTKLGIAKGKKGIMRSITWSKKDSKIDISKLPPGVVTKVPQPEYIIVEVDKTLIPIGLRNDQYRVKGQRVINYRENPCDLLFAVTYHKLQGLTLEKIILSIGKHPISKLRVTMPSLYVGASRVHDLNELRVLPLSDDDKKFLTTLKRDPMLNSWLQNYDSDHKWKPDGFVQAEKARLRKVKMNLALVDDLASLTKEEGTKFIKELDLPVQPDLKSAGHKAVLEQCWKEGRSILEADGGKQLILFRIQELQNLKKLGNIYTVPLKILRIVARRMGIYGTTKMSKKKIIGELDNAAKPYIGNSNCFSRITSTSENTNKKKQKKEASKNSLAVNTPFQQKQLLS